MGKNSVNELKPFLSVMIIIASLFVMMFMKMEVRRAGYSLFTVSRHYRILKDQYRSQVMKYAQITRSERVKKIAVSKYTLNEARVGQIIQMMGTQIALTQ